ncbi:MAG TPA: DUF4097 family beta strand repeat-containing protein [Terriglobales bacterium]|nr:DUF4097 family beta strand repeat-containing protein [Terriglobales bacterium]
MAPTPPCTCPACRLRRLAPPLTLIVLGVLLLAHMLRAGFSIPLLIAVFLLCAGTMTLGVRLAPRAVATNPPHAPRRSLFVPVLLLLVGSLLLAHHLHPALPYGAWIASYWPSLLILWGLIRIVEHYTHPPRLRPGFSAAEVLLVLLIVFGGLAFSGIYRYGHSRWARAWGVNVDTWNPFTHPYEFTGSTSAPLRAGQRVLIRGYYGSVHLEAAPVGGPPAAARVGVQVDDTVRAADSATAQSVFQGAQPQIRPQGSDLLVLPAGDHAASDLQSVLVLTLPASTPVDVQLDNGDVAIAGWKADVAIHTRHGTISADRIQGAVDVTGGGSDVAVSNITGAVTLQGAFFGRLSFRNCAQSVHIHTDPGPGNTDIRLASLAGGLELDPGRITMDRVQDAQVSTRDKAVDIDGFSGPLAVSTGNSPVAATAAQPVAAPVNITDRNADITLTLPPASVFQLQVQIHRGRVTNDFEGAGLSAGAPVISASTSNGDITVRKGPGTVADGRL